ncbi:beta-glucosidase BglX [Elizabethkingia anophelis]|uniref:beta-glucosidase BglX n=1 Tax=Elizabethkingia anophelis TaxID=1117645 RepID=UPI00063AFCA8|nr:beta-glucosidase BglX [Elizabethkingia anophelis]AKH95661.1 beta-D-glucoside glucohydrolase [Elizabethkingia anophelis FMS-007]MCT3663454.1 beta-glucosidase BglX [Elizabethkingia anophelis]MCT3802534.1 beta-glucosidase BglX [Elizabethkingia anophelis]MCT4059447.1 beta-glucosidase BglX [Elizabethkingia anophelis]MCT4070056.1 beta-glucosidase BglX [Elizabethkingia anophelis]
MKKLSIIAGLILAPLFSAQLVHQPVQSFQTEAYTSKKKAFVDKLIAKMTLDEKIGQLNLPSSGDFTTGQAQSSDIGKKIEQGLVGGLFNIKGVGKIRDVQKVAVEKSRLKIPMIFGMDVIHGYETTFPIPLGLSASWDMDLIQRSAQIAAQEASADGINWTFSPMVDVSREPRWGRVSEGSGEDPYLGSQIAKAMVYGYQGKDLSLKNTILACVKHFALYGAPEGGRDYNTVDMSHIRMFNEYFPPYKAAVDAGVGSVMASFNEVDGIPATGNKWLMDDVLRKQWGFNGFIVTDYTGINEMIQHGMGDLQQVSALAMNAGIDMDMVGEGFLTTLKKSISEGKVTEQQITTAARRILEAKYDLGLFDDPYRYTDEKRSKAEVFNKANREEARNIAAQSMVLLKNDKQILPLKASGTVAVIGPLANNNENMTGTWSVASRTKDAVSIMTGLKETIKGVNFIYAKGSNVFYDAKMEEKATMFGKVSNRDSRSKEALLKEAVETAKKADVVVLAIGETAELSGESSSRTNIEIPQAQKDLLIELKKTGKPIVMVLFTGRPLVLNDENKQADAIVNAWFAGSEAGYAIADVLYGKVNPSGKLPMTFPRSVGQVPIYYNAKNTGRPLSDDKSDKCEFEKFRSNYIDECNTPLFPFGFGLSYTSFGYSDVELSKTQLSGNDQLTASITLTNNGKYDGNEVVQLYIRDMVGSVTRPVKELKGFQKVFLKAGESKKVSFTITPEDLKFYNSELKYDWEAGEFDIMIGTNSHEVKHAKINWNK